MSRWSCLSWGLAACLALGCSGGKQQQAQQPAPPSTPEELVRRVADFYRSATGFAADLSQTIDIEMEGTKQTTVAETQIVAQKPNRLAMRTKQGSLGSDIVSDGKELFASASILNTFTRSPAPPTFDALLQSPQFQLMAALGGRGPLLELLAADPYQRIMEGVTTTKYLGRETLDGLPVYHAKFSQEKFAWDLWVAAEGDPVVVQMSVDVSPAPAKADAAPKLFRNLKIHSIQKYKNWRVGVEPPSDAFVFQPPPNAKEESNLLAGGGGQDFQRLMEQFKGSNAAPTAPVSGNAVPANSTVPDATSLPAEVEISTSQGMKLRLALPGVFMMGSPPTEAGRRSDEPIYRVTITKPFYLGLHEVTQQQYREVTGVNPSHFSAEGMGRDAVKGMDTSSFPVENVTWFDAIDFCVILSEREKMPPYYRRQGETVTILGGTGYRLPTEAEWEWACRCALPTCWSFGSAPEQLGEYAWYKANSNNQPHPVGQLKANQFGFFDIYGNAWEWCWDLFAKYPPGPVTDSTGPVAGSGRVLRGGAFHDDIPYVRSASRGWNVPAQRNNSYGFRLARSCPAAF